MRFTGLDRFQVRWLISRASLFWTDARGRERVQWTYPAIARNFRRSKIGAELSGDSVRRLICKRAPELYARRRALFTAEPRTEPPAIATGPDGAAVRLSRGPGKRRGWAVALPAERRD